jgi:hypothetical protein
MEKKRDEISKVLPAIAKLDLGGEASTRNRLCRILILAESTTTWETLLVFISLVNGFLIFGLCTLMQPDTLA